MSSCLGKQRCIHPAERNHVGIDAVVLAECLCKPTATTSREMSSNPLPKQSTSHHHLFFFTKSHASIIGNEFIHADALVAIKSITMYSDVADTSIKTAGPEGHPFQISTCLQKNVKNTELFKITQTRDTGHLPQGSGTYPITMTPCKHTCTPSTN